ncbi:hypothetical protein KGP95_17815 [Burkholderia multivorans]|uniref:hypothetical protein n=1 Tax=Burkholderia multivorans TaxID=87883 RepID=UPI00209EAD38|nr:hypothetical protein [Burkholderia multivorans]MCO8612530.1 hypothetical protein [Burkholderia multivorans]MCO8639185.1 hypothetical protein [Burkholderia multivorans]MCO8647313.1 hypothetical protein [Burkholderia multivorans]
MVERTIEQLRAERDVLAYTFAALCETQPEDARKIMARIDVIEAQLTERTARDDEQHSEQGGALIGEQE